jgi:RNA polymerase sigma-70 factor (ECF subfamily)
MLDKKEFKDLYEAHFDEIRSFVFYRCGDMEAASDVAQDVFLRVWEKRAALNCNPVKPLLYKMATDSYISRSRKEMCRMSFEQSLMPEHDKALSPEDEMLFKEFAAAYSDALEQMSDTQRVPFLMSREDGMKYREIAECLHVSVKTVEKHISAALQFLKSKLNTNR